MAWITKMGTVMLATVMTASCLCTAAAAEGLQAEPAAQLQIAAQTTDSAPMSLLPPMAHSEAEIRAMYESCYADREKPVTYTVQPDISGSYTEMGDISDEDRQGALQTVNLLRYVAGVDSVTLDDDYNTKAQTASTVMAASNQFGHTIARPAGCSEDVYNTAAAGVAGSNIALGYKNIVQSILTGYMYDGESYNVTTLGHRRWLLNPSMGKIGFGIATGADGMDRTATYVKDKSNTGAQPGYIAWPAAITPYDLWTGPMSFQFKCNSNSTVTGTNVTVTSLLEDKTYHFNETTNGTGEGVCYTSITNVSGYYGCIIFGKQFAAGDTLDVSVQYTLDGQAYATQYEVKLLDMSASGEESQPTEGGNQSATGESQPTTGESQPVTGESQPATGESQPATGEDQPVEEGSQTAEGGGQTSAEGTPTAKEGVVEFTDRLYSVCLGREADENGRQDWANKLLNYSISGTKAAYGFIFSKEFESKNYSNAEYVEHLYEALMGRASDAAGKADWVNRLDSGEATREDVFYGFTGSVEFKAICRNYGIVDRDIETFVTRLYAVCLDRKPDTAGLEDWSALLRSGERTGREVAYGFIFSKEFINHEYSDEEYVDHLYAAFLGRAPDAAGKADWLARLDDNSTRDQVFDGFVGSIEFGEICEAYGIIRG